MRLQLDWSCSDDYVIRFLNQELNNDKSFADFEIDQDLNKLIATLIKLKANYYGVMSSLQS